MEPKTKKVKKEKLKSRVTPHSFTPGLKLSFSANPSHRTLPFLL